MKDYRNNIFIPKINDLDEQLDEPYKHILKNNK